jgi:hypothetical protein
MSTPWHPRGWRGTGTLALTAALFLSSPTSAADIWTPLGNEWEQYTNERFGTHAEVPHQQFKLVDPPPANGDGREFKADGGAGLWISGSYGPYVVTDTFQEYKAWLLKHTDLDRVTYKAGGKNWLVLSGTKGTNIVYRKIIEGCGAAHEVRFEYASQNKRLYDPVVVRLSQSLACRSPQP